DGGGEGLESRTAPALGLLAIETQSLALATEVRCWAPADSVGGGTHGGNGRGPVRCKHLRPRPGDDVFGLQDRAGNERRVYRQQLGGSQAVGPGGSQGRRRLREEDAKDGRAGSIRIARQPGFDSIAIEDLKSGERSR